MTRTGSLAYYFAAIACGCFFLAASYFPYFLVTGSKPAAPAREFIMVYFFTIVVGWIPQTLAALLLRRVAVRLNWTRLWQWMLAGSALSLLIFLAMAQVGNAIQHWTAAPAWLRTGLMFIFVGPVFLAQNPLWLPIPAAAATAWVLFLVHRAFQPREETNAPTTAPSEATSEAK